MRGGHCVKLWNTSTIVWVDIICVSILPNLDLKSNLKKGYYPCITETNALRTYRVIQQDCEVNCNFFLTYIKITKMTQLNHFEKGFIGRFWYFDISKGPHFLVVSKCWLQPEWIPCTWIYFLSVSCLLNVIRQLGLMRKRGLLHFTLLRGLRGDISNCLPI